MVDQDVAQAQQELAQQQAEAEKLIQKKVPVRRFGAGVPVQQIQQQILAGRQQGRQILSQIAEQRKQIKTVVTARQQAQTQANRTSIINQIFDRVSKDKAISQLTSKLSRADQKFVSDEIQKISETRGRAERRAISSVEQSLGQSIPASARASVIQQIKAGQTQITIPEFQAPLPTISTQSIIPLSVGIEKQPVLQTIAPDIDIPQTRTQKLKESVIGGLKLVEFGIVQPIVSFGEAIEDFGTNIQTLDIKGAEPTGKVIVGLSDFFPQTKREAEIEFGIGAGAGVGLKVVGVGAKLVGKIPGVKKVVAFGGEGLDFLSSNIITFQKGFRKTPGIPSVISKAPPPLPGVTNFVKKDITDFTSATVNIGGVGLGGVIAVQTVGQVNLAETFPEKVGVVSSVAGDILLFGSGLLAGGRAVDFGVGRIRTLGLKEVPGKDIIAPEFFEGKTFPAVKKGQTAEQLRQEFLIPSLPGEAPGIARGFTASPGTFAKRTEAGKGKSEIFGLFEAPKVSPQFLKISGETKLLDLKGDFTKIPEPTILRLTTDRIELIPGLKPTQTQFTRFDGEVQRLFGGGVKKRGGRPTEFGEPTLKRGTAFIPFIKAEKEAVVPFGSVIETARTRFFIKFKGERVPVVEASTIKPSEVSDFTSLKVKVPKGKRKQTVEELLSSSASDIKPSSIINPLSLGSQVRKGSRSSVTKPVVSSLASLKSDLSSATISVSEASFPTSPTRRPPKSPSLAPPSSPPLSPPRRPPSSPPTSRPPASPPRRPPSSPPTKKPPVGKLPSGKAKRRGREEGFSAFAKPEKGKRFVRLNKQPLSKSKAKDLMAFILDHSLSASGKVRGQKGKVSDVIQTDFDPRSFQDTQRPRTKDKRRGVRVPVGYFARNKRKFREFKIKRGKRVDTKDDFIERRSRRLDTFGERNKISLFKILSNKRITPKTKRKMNTRMNTRMADLPSSRKKRKRR